MLLLESIKFQHGEEVFETRVQEILDLDHAQRVMDVGNMTTNHFQRPVKLWPRSW